jgi:hypothetical protein
MSVRPSFVYFNFQDVKWQKRDALKNAHSSESKSSGDELGTFLYSKLWLYQANSKRPWSDKKIKISPAMQTKGYKTIITNVRFRAFMMGGSNSN